MLGAHTSRVWLVRSDPDDIGQKWIPDFWPRSAKFENQALNIYGGRNGEGNKVGLFTWSKSSNEEWRRADTNWLITRPLANSVVYHFDQINYKKPTQFEAVVSSVLANRASAVAKGTLEYDKSHVESVTSSDKLSLSFDAEFGAGLKVTENELILKEEETMSVTFKFGFG